jgi:hypothetical protein
MLNTIPPQKSNSLSNVSLLYVVGRTCKFHPINNVSGCRPILIYSLLLGLAMTSSDDQTKIRKQCYIVFTLCMDLLSHVGWARVIIAYGTIVFLLRNMKFGFQYKEVCL